jgi:hypothetical protein
MPSPLHLVANKLRAITIDNLLRARDQIVTDVLVKADPKHITSRVQLYHQRCVRLSVCISF